ncbi:MAG: AraC family transcriptional regulator [Roseobacter sp.]
MAYVTSLFARKMVVAAGSVIDARQMLASAGIDHDAPWDPKAMIPAQTYYSLLEALAEQVDVTPLPLRVGASMRCDEYGALGLAWKAAPTLYGSFTRIERYARLWTGVVSYELRPNPRGTLVVLHREGVRRLGLRLSNEATLASAVSLSRQVCSEPFAPIEVFVQHAAPRTKAFHEDWFRCPVTFNASIDGLLISEQAMERPNLLGDEGISRYLIGNLETELAGFRHLPPLVSDAKDAIAQALNEGAPKLLHIATHLGLSSRSFHRRLSEHGLTFQMLTEQTRRELAEALLREDQYSLADIAFLTGFSEQSAFTRAFKRWVGQTPASYRKSSK